MTREIVMFGTKVPLLGSEEKAFEEEDLRPLVEIGLFETGKKFTFQCPICLKVEVNDQRMEPACTGPSWTDDHPLELMVLVR